MMRKKKRKVSKLSWYMEYVSGEGMQHDVVGPGCWSSAGKAHEQCRHSKGCLVLVPSARVLHPLLAYETRGKIRAPGKCKRAGYAPLQSHILHRNSIK